MREQAALAACQLAGHAAETLRLTGRGLYLAEILVRAIHLEPASVGESCCRALGHVLEHVDYQEEQEPFLVNIVGLAAESLLQLMDHSTAPSQVRSLFGPV